MSQFDVIAIGRAGLDLYAGQVGVPFEQVKSFAAYVGGTPANIAVGTRRLGLRSALVTAVSEDPVGDFILHFLREEDVVSEFVRRIPGTKSGMVLLGIMPPDRFPRVHYRENCADQRLSIEDVRGVPVERARALLVVGTSLTHSPAREATMFAAERARAAGVPVILDLDYREDQWPDARAYAVSVRELVRMSDVVIGTREEIVAAAAHGAGQLTNPPSQLLALGPGAVVEKRGGQGARVHRPDLEAIDVPGFGVAVQNTLGAGDAFAAGFLYGRLKGWDWLEAVRFGNACGAIVVSRHACSASCPTVEEVEAFVAEQGGL